MADSRTVARRARTSTNGKYERTCEKPSFKVAFEIINLIFGESMRREPCSPFQTAGATTLKIV